MPKQEIEYLLEATRSSVKRFGGEQPSLSHLAQVLSTKWDDEFAEVFGEDGPERVGLLLKQQCFIGDEAEVTSLLQAGDDRKELLTKLHERLRVSIDQAHNSPPPDANSPPESTESTDLTAPETDSGWPSRTERFVDQVHARDDLVERDDVVDQIISILGRSRRRVPIVIGPRGSGRTSVLGGVAARLSSGDDNGVWRVDPALLGPEPEGALSRIIEDCEPSETLVIDDIDRLSALGTSHPNVMVLRIIRAAAMRPDLRLILSCEARFFPRLSVVAEDLESDLVPVQLQPLGEEAVAQVIGRFRSEVEAEHGVKISPALQTFAGLPAHSTDTCDHPGLALDRLDAAASRARVVGDTEADVHHVVGSTATRTALRTDELQEQLSAQVCGQDHATHTVASRLALTLARLDLNPGRPDGVFLFVGPTGVGKTKMASALSRSLFGSETQMIRLDMSEYSHDWAVSRLVGPMPGYVGSTEPDNWLTTRVTKTPDCVILLDEIEKAHPVVWNTFLQVFDAGRLTDSRGVTADFSNAVIVMTSNLGAAAASGPGLGFGSESASADRARQKILGAVKESMAPELINRMDEIVVFDPLGLDAIEGIAQQEMALVTERLAESGWSVAYQPEVIKHLALSGYDPAYGARHLQRNIEREFLGPIANSSGKSVVVEVSAGAIVVKDA